MKKDDIIKKISLNMLLNVLLLLATVLLIMAILRDNRQNAKKLIAQKITFAEKGTDFSITEYNETSTTKWGRRVYTIRGKIKFDECLYLLESEIKQSTIHPTLILAKKKPGDIVFNMTITKGRNESHYIDAEIHRKLVTESRLKAISSNGIVIVDGQPVFNSEKILKNLSDLLMSQRDKIAKYSVAIEKEYSNFTEDFATFKKGNFVSLNTTDRLQFLNNFEKKLHTHLQFLSKGKNFYQELAFARQSPWNKFIVYPAEIDKLEKKMKINIDKYGEITSNASVLLKERLSIHQQIKAGHSQVLQVRDSFSIIDPPLEEKIKSLPSPRVRTPQPTVQPPRRRARRVYPLLHVNLGNKNRIENKTKRDHTGTTKKTSSDIDTIELKINTL